MSALETIEVLPGSPRVTRITVPNPGPKTLTGTQTYVVGMDPAYIIDPGPALTDHLTNLIEWLNAQRIRPAGILLTHTHPDHAPGAPVLAEKLGVPILASARIAAATAERLGGAVPLNATDSLAVADDTLGVIDTPGHAPDHLAFWLPASGILFSGDVILGEGTTLVAPPEGDMLDYLQTLATLRDLPVRVIAPGHGPLVTSPPEKIDEYIDHRRRREEQILDVLDREPMDIAGIVRAVYTDVDDRVLPLAGGSVEAQLIKLEREGKVRRHGGHFARAT